ncbi:tRNA lysidine(34) synthetase TilS [bacterium]|nr:tRNA lysidine(34) synthetase TilS [bacterium]
MISEVENFLIKHKIQDKKVIVGFSGGPDSCAIAFLLYQLARKHNLKLVLAYFNHNWRPKEAREECDFAFEFANKINAEFYSETADINSAKTEEVARELRYAFFEKCMKKYDSDIVFLAHNKNDNIETAVYRLIKGTGVRGLCSIPKVRDNFYRPLLEISKEEILDFLDKNKIEYKIDSSNEDIRYKRNLIRKEILPLFEKINPSYLSNIENLIKNANSVCEILNVQLQELIEDLIIDDCVIRDKYIEKTQAQRYEFLNYFVGDNLKCRNYKNIKKIDDFIMKNSSSQISINKVLFLRIKKNKIFYVVHNNYDKKD